MRKLSLLSIALVSSIFCLASATATAAKPAEGCRFQGSWIGFKDDRPVWVSTADGQNAAYGTYVLESPGFDITLSFLPSPPFPHFPDAKKGTVLRGSWERIDDYSFAITVVGLVIDSDGTTLYSVKLSAIDTLSSDCDQMQIVNTTEFFLGDEDPFVDAPFLAVPGEPHLGYRMSVDPLAPVW